MDFPVLLNASGAAALPVPPSRHTVTPDPCLPEVPPCYQHAQNFFSHLASSFFFFPLQKLSTPSAEISLINPLEALLLYRRPLSTLKKRNVFRTATRSFLLERSFPQSTHLCGEECCFHICPMLFGKGTGTSASQLTHATRHHPLTILSATDIKGALRRAIAREHREDQGTSEVSIEPRSSASRFPSNRGALCIGSTVPRLSARSRSTRYMAAHVASSP
jgi:hypothetical protein